MTFKYLIENYQLGDLGATRLLRFAIKEGFVVSKNEKKHDDLMAGGTLGHRRQDGFRDTELY